MPVIKIQQYPNAPQKATLSFSHGTNYEIEIKPPFDEQQEKTLEWYFEEYLKFPFTEQVKFQQISTSIQQYGENLFEQVFGQRKAYADYSNALQNEVLLIEIVGDAIFHALHWEALKDPDMAEPLAVRFALSRKPVSSETQRQAVVTKESPVLRVLLVTSRPQGKHDVGYRTISQPLLEAIRNSQLPVQIDLLRPATYEALIKHLESCDQGFYHILHFDVHGSVLDYESVKQGVEIGAFLFDSHYGTSALEPYDGKKAFLFLDGDDNNAHPIEAADLKVLLARHGIPVVVLNACQSAKQRGEQETSLGSLLMQAGIDGVVAMAYSVTVTAAALYVKTLYQQLLQHHDFNAAAQRARFELHQNKQRRAYYNQSIALEDWLLPVLYQQQPIKLALRAFYQEEKRDWHRNKAKQYKPPKTEYGFVGRDLDVLEIEKRLIKDNVLLIQGMGGAGKTTLLHHLMYWWQVTHFVGLVFYFGYDEKAYNRQQILHGIAGQLLSADDFKYCFLPEDESIQQSLVADVLRETRHCLVLDNLESVTGAALSIPHCLDAQQQADLKDFLQALVGGHTLVVLGSRGEEAWLQCPATPYYLLGLDVEAASSLADKILSKHQALYYRDSEHRQDLLILLKLLAGFPLALEVVLSNLKSQTPAEVLKALQQGEAAIDFASKDKTQSVLTCIEYSHSALSAEAQTLLLCLAPFKEVLCQSMLEGYSKKLKAQVVFTSLSFDNWQAILDEARNWGLVKSHEVEGFISLQPTLSYFLNNRLQQNKEKQQAILLAFRMFYEDCAAQLYSLMHSNDLQQNENGQLYTFLEFENLSFALQMALDNQASFIYVFSALSTYLSYQGNWQQCLELGLLILDSYDENSENFDKKNQTEIYFLMSQAAYHERKCQKSIKYSQLALENGVFLNDAGIQGKAYHRLGDAAFQQRKWQQAISYYKKAIPLKKEKNQPSSYHKLGWVAQEQKQWQEATEHYQKAIDIAIKFDDYDQLACTYHQLGWTKQEQGEFEQAKKYYNKALKINDRTKDKDRDAHIYHQLGTIFLEQNDYSQAFAFYQKALKKYIELNERYRQASTYYQLGNLAYKQSQWLQAADYCQKALDFFAEFDDQYGQARTYQLLGTITEEQKQWQQAHKYYQKALDFFVELNDQSGQADAYQRLGSVAHEQEQWKQAQHYYWEALKIFTALYDNNKQAFMYSSLGIIAMQQKQWQRAQQRFSQTLIIFTELNNDLGQAVTISQLGFVAEEQENWKQAQDYLLKALKIFVTNGDKSYHSILLTSLKRIYQGITISVADTDKAASPNLAAQIAAILNSSEEEIQAFLEQDFEDSEDSQD